ncbi:hypothetical protein FRC01_014343, partial [Tulasnella sp. 417]
MLFTHFAFAFTAVSVVSALPIRVPEQIRHSGLAQRADAINVNDVLDQLSNNGTLPVVISPNDGGAPKVVIGGNATQVPQGGSEKIVLAHFMIGNAFSYTKDLWKKDIQMAQDAGVDGFALNLG